jgi:hypothetical protein
VNKIPLKQILRQAIFLYSVIVYLSTSTILIHSIWRLVLEYVILIDQKFEIEMIQPKTRFWIWLIINYSCRAECKFSIILVDENTNVLLFLLIRIQMFFYFCWLEYKCPFILVDYNTNVLLFLLIIIQMSFILVG